MTLNGKTLTPSQYQLIVTLLREEAQIGRLKDAHRAKAILTKIGEEL